MFENLEWDDARQLVAFRALELGQYSLACRIFTLQTDTGHLRTLVPLAIQAKDFGSAYDALKFLGDMAGLRELGAASLEGGDYIIAELSYGDVGDLKGLRVAGKRAVASGDFKIGLPILKRVLSRLENTGQVLRDLAEAGVAAMARKNLPAALEAIEAAQDKEHALELGNMALRTQNYKIAINAFSIAGDKTAINAAKEKLEEQNERKDDDNR